ncbi:NADPH-dependent methylglyoxal reductase-like protein [Hapsidospora chrysogenum ATCC 11550]|uniref:NADPH-dependent methylglyoxal reductase-like protein n=1 Tax=Hapsidospora chrysogenum (strain ATCC 11550 / CBS 779.69 / DSM 880 / IAM 14645 / JCM 23072 / IMI 49137) TaxID=857340 RepID=A0A086T9H8_HAPC1|nr:NADPH-dependent methylglyoxal reductase-like protein [Hapsidospora chrysogenum ATCC 11550]
MPSRTATPVLPPDLVVVTGANGFIAQHCVAALLRQGYRVVGTVRSQAKATAVLEVHGQHPRLTTVVVQDITSRDAYLAQLAPLSPSAILHLAAPFTYATTDYERDLMIPSVRGATALLEAASQIRSVRRVVQTNSFACIYDADAGPSPGKTYTARDWSPLTYEDGVRAPNPPTAYRASKTAAERAACDFMRSCRPQFDLVSLCPAMVFGAFLPGAAPRSIKSLNTSNALVHAVVSAPGGGSNGGDAPIPPTKGPVWVDVRDVADAHLRSLSTPEAGGERFLLAAGVYCNQEIADVSRRVLAEASPKLRTRIPVGEPGRRESHLHFGVDARAAEEVLGMRWRGLGDCLAELVPQLYGIEHGDE